ncbi:MAG TPA: hypothetical protein VL403_00225, partial [Candidatus Kryptonia bacterium]|nr:hypothetical protein [Candidatus Kryptonia bacterium]
MGAPASTEDPDNAEFVRASPRSPKAVPNSGAVPASERSPYDERYKKSPGTAGPLRDPNRTMTSLTWRWLTVAGITLLAGFLLYPSVSWYTLSPAERQDREAHHERPRWLLNLGLDLRGGTHLVMTVEVDKAIESSLDRDAADLKREATEAKIPVDAAVRHDSHIELSLSSSADRNQFNDFVKEHFPNLSIQDSTTRDGRTTLQLIITEQEEKRIRDSALDQSLETIRNRVDQFGVAEPIIQREGDRDILVQLPGIQDPEHAKALIGKTALLEFKLVAKDPSA